MIYIYNMSKFLLPVENFLYPNLSNITQGGIVELNRYVEDNLLEDGKFRADLMPNISLTSITIVADATERLALTVQSGDGAKQSDDGSTWVYNGSVWIEITDPKALSELSDVLITTLASGHTLRYNGTKWVNIPFHHSNLSDVSSNYNHNTIDSHIDNNGIHFTQAQINHSQIIGVGTNTHAQIDSSITAYNSHAANTAIHRNNNTTFVNIGQGAGGTNYGSFEIAIGVDAGTRSTLVNNTYNIAVGAAAGSSTGGYNLFLGSESGPYSGDCNYTNTMGYQAGLNTCHSFCNVLNATGSALDTEQASSFYVSPIRSLTNSNLLMYNTTTKEITSNNLLTTKGDILSHNSTDLTRLAVGTNGQVLTANSSTSTGLEWTTVSTVGTLNDLTDVIITSAATRQILNHNGTNWVNTSTPTIDKLTFPSSNGARIIELLSNSGTYWDFLGNYVYDQVSNPLFARWGCSLYSSQSYQITKGDPSSSANYLFTCDSTGKGYFKAQLSIGTFNQDYALVIGAGTSGMINSGTNQFSATASTWTIASSRLIKRDITERDTTTALDDLLTVRVKDYKYITGEDVCTGVIAEELLETPLSCCIEQVSEHAVKDCRTNKNTIYKNLNVFKQEKLFWRMLEGIQELIKENRELKTRILTLENIISNI